MTIDADTIEPIAKVVKLSSKDWKAIATLLIVSCTLLCGISYAIARQIVDSKVSEINASSTRITAVEKTVGIMQEQLSNQGKNQDQIMKQLGDISRDLKDVGQSVARIEGRNSVLVPSASK